MKGLTPLFLEAGSGGLQLARRSPGEGRSAELKRA
jgi:hypothetical protein